MASPYDNVPGKIFLGGISAHTTYEIVHKYFSSFGELIDCVVMQDRATGKSRGFGFITYKDSQVTNTVLSQTHVIDGKELDCKRAVPRDQRNESSQNENSFRTKKLFVGGLTQTTTEESFKEYFEQFGKIEDWVIMVDKATGKSRGFGFITFESEDSVEMAVSLYLENKIDGKWVECKKALPRDANSGTTISQTSTTTVSPSVSAHSSKKTSLNQKAGETDQDIVRGILGYSGARISPSVSNHSSKKNSLNQKPGESDQDIVRGLLGNYNGSKFSVDSGPRFSVENELESNMPVQHFQNGQPNINLYADKPSFWESLLGPSDSNDKNLGDNMQGGEPERYTRRETVYYQYQPPFLQQQQQPTFQQQQPNFQPQQNFQQQQMNQKSQGFNNSYGYINNNNNNSQPKFVPTQDITSPTNYKMPPVYKQEPSPMRPEQDPMNFPPGLSLYDTSSQGYSFDPTWVETKSNPLMNQFQMDMLLKGPYQTQNQQQTTIPQKKVEKYIPLYESNNISSNL